MTRLLQQADHRKGGRSVVIILAITTAVCGIGWLVRWLNTTALLLYMLRKGCPLPTNEELRECAYSVLAHLINPKI